jgi:uncharacterized membrane protein YeaQ/YmgE (transglycosylase-associated protein family)
MSTERIAVEHAGPAIYDRTPTRWPVLWSSVWVGALAAIALILVIGLVGTSIGANQAGHHFGTRTFGLGSLVFSVFGAFISFVAGGWVAAKIAGLTRSEPAMLHGAILWLVSIPFLLAFAALGAASLFGTWYGGLAGTPAWAAVAVREGAVATATSPAAALATRNAALGALTALLLGLVGSVIGGWMGSGESMILTRRRLR